MPRDAARLSGATTLRERFRPSPVAAAAIALGALHVALALLALEPAPYAGGDNAAYVGLARSLVTRGEYAQIWDPAAPPETLYPPLFPVLLALPVALGAGWIALKIAMVALSGLAVGLTVVWLGRTLPLPAAVVAGVAVAAVPGLLAQTHTVLSEIPFWLFVTLALLALRRAAAQDTGPRRWLVLAAVATALAWLTRSAGVTLAAAGVLSLLLSRRARDAALFGVVAAAPAALWWLRNRRVSAGGGYGEMLLFRDPYQPEAGTIGVADLALRVAANARAYLLELAPRFLVGADATTVARAVAITLVVVALARWLVRLVRAPRALELWLLCYVGLLLVWPETWAGERFVLPIGPAIVWYAADALHALGARGRAARGAVRAVAAGACVAVAAGAVAQARRGIDCRTGAEAATAFPCTEPHWRDLFDVAASVRGRLPAGAVVISRKPSLFFDLSGYASTMYPLSDVPADLFALADSVGATHVVLDRSIGLPELYLVPVLEAQPEAFCVVQEHSQPFAVLFRIDRAGTRSPPQDGPAGMVRFRTCDD